MKQAVVLESLIVGFMCQVAYIFVLVCLCCYKKNGFRLGSLETTCISLSNCLETGKSKIQALAVSESGKGALPDSCQPYFHSNCTGQREGPRRASEVSFKTTLTPFMSSNLMI